MIRGNVVKTSPTDEKNLYFNSPNLLNNYLISGLARVGQIVRVLNIQGGYDLKVIINNGSGGLTTQDLVDKSKLQETKIMVSTPTASTTGKAGDVIEVDGTLYECFGQNNNEYIWKKVGFGGGAIFSGDITVTPNITPEKQLENAIKAGDITPGMLVSLLEDGKYKNYIIQTIVQNTGACTKTQSGGSYVVASELPESGDPDVDYYIGGEYDEGTGEYSRLFTHYRFITSINDFIPVNGLPYRNEITVDNEGQSWLVLYQLNGEDKIEANRVLLPALEPYNLYDPTKYSGMIGNTANRYYTMQNDGSIKCTTSANDGQVLLTFESVILEPGTYTLSGKMTLHDTIQETQYDRKVLCRIDVLPIEDSSETDSDIKYVILTTERGGSVNVAKNVFEGWFKATFTINARGYLAFEAIPYYSVHSGVLTPCTISDIQIVEGSEIGIYSPNNTIPNDVKARTGVREAKAAIDTIAENINESLLTTRTIQGDYLTLTRKPDYSILKTIINTAKTDLGVVVGGKNLICYPYANANTRTHNGITYTVNESDKSITANGTATGDSSFNISQNGLPACFPKRGNGKYGGYLSGCTGGSAQTFYIAHVSSGHKQYNEPFLLESSVGLATGFQIVIKSGVTVTNKVFRPMFSVAPEVTYDKPATLYRATVESGTEEYTWQNIVFRDGYNTIVPQSGDSLNISVDYYFSAEQNDQEIREVEGEIFNVKTKLSNFVESYNLYNPKAEYTVVDDEDHVTGGYTVSGDDGNIICDIAFDDNHRFLRFSDIVLKAGTYTLSGKMTLNSSVSDNTSIRQVVCQIGTNQDYQVVPLTNRRGGIDSDKIAVTAKVGWFKATFTLEEQEALTFEIIPFSSSYGGTDRPCVISDLLIIAGDGVGLYSDNTAIPADLRARYRIDQTQLAIDNRIDQLAVQLETAKLDAAPGAVKTTHIDDGAVTLPKLGTGVIDNTLTSQGAAAEAKATGDKINSLESLNESYNLYDPTAEYTIINARGGTNPHYTDYVIDPNGTITCTAYAQDDQRLFLNSAITLTAGTYTISGKMTLNDNVTDTTTQRLVRCRIGINATVKDVPLTTERGGDINVATNAAEGWFAATFDIPAEEPLSFEMIPYHAAYGGTEHPCTISDLLIITGDGVGLYSDNTAIPADLRARYRIDQLATDVEKTAAELTAKINNDTETAREFLTLPDITFIDDYGVRYDTGELAYNETYSHVVLDVSAFAGGAITGYSGASNLMGVAFYDGTGAYISGFGNTVAGTYAWNIDGTIPPNAAFAKIHCRKNYQDSFHIEYDWTCGLSNVLAGIADARGAKISVEKIYDDIDPSKQIIHRLKFARHVRGNSSAPLTLLHISDIHADTGALERILADAAKYPEMIDGKICTGDMVSSTAAQITGWWDPDVMTCIGNHDSAAYDSSTGYNWTALSMADRESYYITPFASHWGAIVHTPGTSYYYKDYPSQAVRLIVLDVMLYSISPTTAEANAQTAWLANALTDARTNNLHVLIALHAPHANATAVTCNFSRVGQAAMPLYTDCNTPDDVINAVAAAITNGLHFIGYLCGHTHQDNIWDAAGDGSQIMYCVTCGAVRNPDQWKNSDQHRDDQNDAFNLVTIDTAHTLVKIVRGGGADMDNLMRPRKAICFDYSNGTNFLVEG